MGSLSRLGEFLKNDTRRTDEVDLWGDVLPKACQEVFGRSLSYTEITEALEVSPWEDEFAAMKFDRVCDFGAYLIR